MRERFPEKYIGHGDFVLHSGQHSEIFYDARALFDDPEWRDYILKQIPESPHYVGIKTGGAEIAWQAHLKNPRSLVSFIEKDGRMNGIFPFSDYLLLDDIITTEDSLAKAIKDIGLNPQEIRVIMDRRQIKNLKVTSIFEL